MKAVADDVMVAAISSNCIESCVLAHFIIILAQSCSIQSPDKCYKRVFSELIMPLALFLAIPRVIRAAGIGGCSFQVKVMGS